MNMWSEDHTEMGQDAVVQKSFRESGWLGRLVSRRRDGRARVAAADCFPDHDKWRRKIQSLSEECDALRRKMQCSA
jgi:hypothetical protein